MQKSDAKDSLQGYIVLISSLFVFFKSFRYGSMHVDNWFL